MNILITTNTYYPLKDGISIVAQYLSEGLIEKGHSVTVFTIYRGENCVDEIRNKVRIKRYKIKENCLKICSGETDAYIQDVLSFPADLIINEYIDCALTNLLLPYIGKIKCIKILHLHGMSGLLRNLFSKQNSVYHYIGNIFHSIRNRIYYAKLPKFLKKYNGIICLSELDESFRYLNKIGYPDIYILGNACDDNFYEEYSSNILEKYSLPSKFLLSVANYMPRKNQIGILHSYLKCRFVDYALIFIGSKKNDYYNKLLDEYNTHKDDKHKVIMLTSVPRDDIASITYNASVTLALSTWEGYSISLIESMACGVPFISSNTGNVKELPGGIIINNEDEMAMAIDRLLSDPDMYQNLRIHGRIYAEQFCKKKNRVDQLIEIITECSKKGNKRK